MTKVKAGLVSIVITERQPNPDQVGGTPALKDANLKRRSLIAALRQCRRARNWLCVFSVALVVFQSVGPMSASASGDAMWVEICGEFGVQTVQLDMSGDEPDEQKPCLDCDDCAFCGVAGTDAISVWMKAVADISRTSEAYVLPLGVLADNPAQFWPDCRGPPRTDMDKSTPAIRSAVGSILSCGDTPWT